MKAFLIHLLISIGVAGTFCLVTVFGWYPAPLLGLQGGITVVGILIAMDAILGPTLTLIVFNPRKTLRERTFDIGFIALLQATAFAYGASVIYLERPQYLVFAETQFFVIKHGEAIGTENPSVETAQRYGRFGPKIVFATIPKEHIASGAALVAGFQGDPTFALDATTYQPLSPNLAKLAREALDPAEIAPLLNTPSPKEQNNSPKPSMKMLYFPLKGRARTALAIVDGASGKFEDIRKPEE